MLKMTEIQVHSVYIVTPFSIYLNSNHLHTTTIHTMIIHTVLFQSGHSWTCRTIRHHIIRSAIVLRML